MTRQTVIHGNRIYEITPDVLGRDRVLVIGTLTDDADGRPLAREAELTASEDFVFAAQSDREVALGGNPRVAFADRSLAHDVTVTISAEGYRDAAETVTIPAFAAFPHRNDFTLRRLPHAVTGRVYGRNGAVPPENDPLASAEISLDPVPNAAGDVPMLLRQPLQAPQSSGATVQRRAFLAAPDVAMIEPAARGQRLAGLVDGSGVAPGNLLRLGPAGRPRYSEVASIVAHPDFAAPAVLVELTEPLPISLRSGVNVARLTPGAFQGPVGILAGQSFAGESVLWVSALPDLGGILTIQEAGQPVRYHDANVLTGADGDYLIESFARVGQPGFTVSAPGFTPQTRTFPAARLRAGPLDWFLAP